MRHREKESKKNMPNKNNKYRLYRYNWIHISIRHPIFRRTLFVRLVEKLWPILYLFGFYVWPKATLIDAEAKRSFECILNMYLFTCQLILSSMRYRYGTGQHINWSTHDEYGVYYRNIYSLLVFHIKFKVLNSYAINCGENCLIFWRKQNLQLKTW